MTVFLRGEAVVALNNNGYGITNDGWKGICIIPDLTDRDGYGKRGKNFFYADTYGRLERDWFVPYSENMETDGFKNFPIGWR